MKRNLEELYTTKWFHKRTTRDAPIHEHNASVIGGSIARDLEPDSVLDLGAGSCVLVNALLLEGVKHIVAVEGVPYAADHVAPGVEFVLHDLRDSLDMGRPYDVVVSTSVGEHIEPEFEDIYIATIFKHIGKYLVYSASTRKNTLHFNRKAYGYWVGKFEGAGLIYRDDMVEKWREEWRSKDVSFWYADELMVFETSSIFLSGRQKDAR